MLDESLDKVPLNNVGSLLTLSIKYVVENLALYATKNVELLRMLPSHIKNKILKRFTTSSHYWRNVDFKTVLSAIVNDNTSHINLTLVEVDDEMLRILRNCKNMRRLYLSTRNGNLITKTGLTSLLQCAEELYMLLVTYCDKIDDSVLECLADSCPNLMGLDIRGCKNVTDVGVKNLSKLRNLTWLTFSHTQISDDGLIHLVEGPSGRKIKELRIENCSGVTEVGLDAIAKNCPNIEVLMFYNCSLTDSVVPSFQGDQLKHLKQLTWTFSW